MKQITVLLADDNKGVRRDFRKILELEDDLEVIGEAKTGFQAITLVKKLRPALVLMEFVMPLLNGPEATRKILEAAPATKVLMLSVHSDDPYIEETMRSALWATSSNTPLQTLSAPRSGKSKRGIFFSAHRFRSVFKSGL